MDWNIFGLICLAIISTCLICMLYLLSLLDEEEEVNPVSEEDMALMQFLETRQALNEEFLATQQKLLDELK